MIAWPPAFLLAARIIRVDGEVCGFSAAEKVANGALHACFIDDETAVSAITQRVISARRLIFNAPIREIISSPPAKGRLVGRRSPPPERVCAAVK